jgi:magnesium chelatase subunit H
LKFIPGEKAGDLKIWLQAYRYWNQGGSKNVTSMLELLEKYYKSKSGDKIALSQLNDLPDLEVTPDIGLLHPLLYHDIGTKEFFTSPKKYLSWRESKKCSELADKKKFQLAPNDAPRVAILLYRKHVITNQRYIDDLITIIEAQGIIPVSNSGFVSIFLG